MKQYIKYSPILSRLRVYSSEAQQVFIAQKQIIKREKIVDYSKNTNK